MCLLEQGDLPGTATNSIHLAYLRFSLLFPLLKMLFDSCSSTKNICDEASGRQQIDQLKAQMNFLGHVFVKFFPFLKDMISRYCSSVVDLFVGLPNLLFPSTKMKLITLLESLCRWKNTIMCLSNSLLSLCVHTTLVYPLKYVPFVLNDTQVLVLYLELYISKMLSNLTNNNSKNKLSY